jgi:hypothetical protein
LIYQIASVVQLVRAFGRAAAIFAVVFLALHGASGAIPTTAPAIAHSDLPPEVEVAVHKINAADRSVIPTALLWLGSEQDGMRVGKGSPRLRLSCQVAMRMQLKEAVPWLVTLYENPTGDPVIRNIAAETAIRVDPYYSMDFLHDVLSDDFLSFSRIEPLNSAQRAALGALVASGDEDARAMMLQMFQQYLSALASGVDPTGSKVPNAGIAYEFSKLSDSVMIDRVAALREQYPQKWPKRMLEAMIRQLHANQQPVEELVRTARSNAPEDLGGRSDAVYALGHKAGADVLPILKAIRQTVRPRDKIAASQPTTEPAATEPSTRPDTPPSPEAKLLVACDTAIKEIELRTPVPVEDGPKNSAATQRAILPGEKDVPDDAEIVRPENVFASPVNGTLVHFMIFYDMAGVLPATQTLIKSDALFEAIHRISYGTLAQVTLSDDRSSLQAIRTVHISPGENSPSGYVFEGMQTLKEDQWEHTALTLRKFGLTRVVRIPNRRHGDGTFGPDAKMSALAATFAQGDTVEATIEPGPGPAMLTFVSRYRPPMPARLVKLSSMTVNGSDQPAVELVVAHQHETYLLPAAGDPRSILDSAAIAGLSQGTELKVVMDETADPPALISVRLDAQLATTRDGSIVGLRAGRASFTARRNQDYRISHALAGPREQEISRLRNGLTRFLSDPAKAGPLTADTIASLRQAETEVNSAGFQPGETTEIKSLVTRWAAAGADDRPELERQLALQLSQIGARLTAREEQFRQKAKALFTPGQYRETLAMGRVNQLRINLVPAAEDARTKAIDAANKALAEVHASTRPTTAP